jgi:hypothetical protein
MKRYIFKLKPYVKNLLSRNWFQVKNSESILAIGTINKETNIVNGGTGYAVMLSIQHNKKTYVFDQNDNLWYKWDYKQKKFINTQTPILTSNFAGIGTRNINKNGINAIKSVLNKTFNNKN